MVLCPAEIARMIDLSCVRTTSSQADIEEMAAAARAFGFGQVSVNQCFVPYTLRLLEGSAVRVVGNVSFPSGSDSTVVKVFQARQLAAAGCHEIDMVLNVGMLRSGLLAETAADARAVVEAVRPLPVKIIIEIMDLTPGETEQACRICVESGAAFVKTGTGWAARGTTLADVQRVKALVGDLVQIKASGGIRSLEDLLGMYRAGATRFGINLKSGIEIVRASQAVGAAA